MSSMIEDEAEVGYDNEEDTDDKVKIVTEEEEHIQAGCEKDEDLDADLDDLINNEEEVDGEDINE